VDEVDDMMEADRPTRAKINLEHKLEENNASWRKIS